MDSEHQQRKPFLIFAILFCVFSFLLLMTNESMDSSALVQWKNYTRSTQPPMVVNTSKLSKAGCTSASALEFRVPNIVHYIWFQSQPVDFRFDKVLAVLSAIKFIKPDVVYFHTNAQPTGKYFDLLLNISIFKVVSRQTPTSVISHPHFETDYADIDRLKILLEQGGIYLDFDVMVTQPFEDLRRYSCTLGLEYPGRVCSGVIVCAANHPFLYMWLNSYYDDFRPVWAYNSGLVSAKLLQRYQNITHVEKTKLHRPNYMELDQIWGRTMYNWTDNYTVHTWIRKAMGSYLRDYPSPESIKSMKSTYGELARVVYYGSPDLILE